jgi:hypothetical protein
VGVWLPLHNAIWRQSWAKSKSGLAFLLTFFYHQKYTDYSIEQIMEDSEDPSAKIVIFLNYDNYDFLE